MDAANLHEPPRPSATAGPGELVLQNGRQAGARRPLGTPTTFIGRTAGCDIRLNVDGVDPMHCVLAIGPTGVQLRDLNSVHGTYVNGERVENMLLRHGDLVKVGPFQFRVELSAMFASHADEPDNMPVDDYRATLRIQAAAVAAQQAALEEEEARLQQRRSDLQQQEGQLAAHLAEKQRQVQLWSEYTKAERETLRKEKIEQEKRLGALEQELLQAKQDLSNDRQTVTLERQRINKVYQRLRQRWQHQWATAREKHLKQTKKLQAEITTLEERESAHLATVNAHAQAVVRFNTERELGTRQLRESQDLLIKSQQSWRHRRSLERLVLKSKQRELDEAQLKLKQAHQILLQEKDTWNKQLDRLQKELHGLNNRVLHQRLCVQEQTAEIVRLDLLLRDRQMQAGEWKTILPEGASAETLPECDVIVLTDEQTEATAEGPAHPDPDPELHRFSSLEQLTCELADQRVQLIEQYQCLAEIQEAWQQLRDHASAELEALALRLLDQKQSLDNREQRTAVTAGILLRRQHDTEAIRQEIQVWRAQLRAREQVFEQEHQKQMLALRQKEAVLEEQLSNLASTRQRWNSRRQEELQQLRANLVLLDEQQTETQQMRVSMFEKGQHIEEEKRILAEKALALEQYRQEVFFRAKDPAAQRRVERLRRRWVTLNAGLIRDAKSEREATKKELLKLDAQRAVLKEAASQLTQNDAALAETQALLEEREAILTARHALWELELRKLENERQQSEEKQLRIQDEVETFAKAVFEEADLPAIERAA